MKSELIRVHHAEYQEDIPFWIHALKGLDPILEIGCGHGRVTLPLLGSGYRLVGIDSDNTPLAFLRKVVATLPKEDQARISLIEGDILDYQPVEKFGGVIIPCNTYSTFNAGSRTKLLEKVVGFLNEGGLFIAGLPNPVLMEQIHRETLEAGPTDPPDSEGVFSHPETGYPVLVSSGLRPGKNSLFWDWIYDHLRPDGEVDRIVATVEHHPATLEQLLEELDRSGFGDVICLGDYESGDYSQSSPYLLLICRK